MDCFAKGFLILGSYVQLPVCGFMNINAGAYKDQKIASDPLVLRLHMIVSCPTVVLETDSGPLLEQGHCAISPAQCVTLKIS